MRGALRVVTLATLAGAFQAAGPVWAAAAADSAVAPASAPAPAFVQAMRQARAATLLGPGRVSLQAGLELVLPEDTEFIPAAPARALLDALGQDAGPNLVGLIQPHGRGEWMTSVRYDPVGRMEVPADHEWQEDRLLEGLRARLKAAPGESGTEPQVLGWAQRPAFDPHTQRLVWSVRLRRAGRGASAAGSEEWVNYNVLALGRHGVLSLGLTTPAATLTRDKRLAHVLLAGAHFLPGERLQDGDAQEDARAPMPLEDFIAPPSTRAPEGTDGKRPTALVGLLVAVASGLGYAFWRLKRRPTRRPRPATGTAPASR